MLFSDNEINPLKLYHHSEQDFLDDIKTYYCKLKRIFILTFFLIKKLQKIKNIRTVWVFQKLPKITDRLLSTFMKPFKINNIPLYYVNTRCIDLSIILANKELRDPLSSSARSCGVPSIEFLDCKFVSIILKKCNKIVCIVSGVLTEVVIKSYSNFSKPYLSSLKTIFWSCKNIP